ncbi:MAG: VWA-like domain-containing protein, partial [Clostridia bacterium]
CDIVVDSWLLNELKFDKEDFLTIEYPTHTALNGVEGNQYSAEEVYDMFVKENRSLSAMSKKRGYGCKIVSIDGNKNDSHSNWEMLTADEKNILSDIWKQHIKQARKMAEENFSNGYFEKNNVLYDKMFGKLTQKNADWVKKLNTFLQTDRYDYSFAKPDYRYDDLPFFLPYFDVVDSQAIYYVWFVIDVSDSIGENELSQALSEIVSSIAQMDGLLKGYYSFFSNQISEPLPFENPQDISLRGIQTTGGTSFDVIFDKLKIWPKDKLPSNIVILSDGNCDYPKKEDALGIPTLWLINNDKITPPWGIVARME